MKRSTCSTERVGRLEGVPDVTKTKPTTITYHTDVIGAAQTFTVQTYRQRHEKDTPKGPKVWTEDTILVTYVDAKGSRRIVIPDPVAAVIARQRDSLSTMFRASGWRVTSPSGGG